jgi:hypothetical protein
MEWELARGLREYVRQVAQACGSGDVFSVQLETPLSAYIPLENRVDAFPELDVALLWDARTGWSSAVETATNELITLTYLTESLVPSPEAVAAFAMNPAAGSSTPIVSAENAADLVREYGALRPLAG